MKGPASIRALFSLPGFVAAAALKGVFGDRYARVIVLRRRKKRRCAPAVAIDAEVATTGGPVVRGTSRWLGGASRSSSSVGGSIALDVARCS